MGIREEKSLCPGHSFQSVQELEEQIQLSPPDSSVLVPDSAFSSDTTVVRGRAALHWKCEQGLSCDKQEVLAQNSSEDKC